MRGDRVSRRPRATPTRHERRVLLDVAPHLVENSGVRAHDVKRVEHRDGAGQFVADRVG